MNHADVQRTLAEPDRRAMAYAAASPAHREVFRSPIRPGADKPNAPSCRSPSLQTQRAFAAQHQLALRRFTVASDICFRADPATGWRPRLLLSSPTTDSIADAPFATRDQPLRREQHRRDDAFGVACSAAPDEFVVFPRRIKRRHGVHMRGKGDHRLVRRREYVIAMRFHFNPLHLAAGSLRQAKDSRTK